MDDILSQLIEVINTRCQDIRSDETGPIKVIRYLAKILQRIDSYSANIFYFIDIIGRDKKVRISGPHGVKDTRKQSVYSFYCSIQSQLSEKKSLSDQISVLSGLIFAQE